MQELLREYLVLIVERMTREADVSDGTKVPHGSSKHIKDLEARIDNLMMWRDKQKRGTETRANYTRLINRLKTELASAKRALDKRRAQKRK